MPVYRTSEPRNSLKTAVLQIGESQSFQAVVKLENYGIIELRKEGRNIVPCVVYDEIELHVPLAA
jgi:predicted transcriptional regulator